MSSKNETGRPLAVFVGNNGRSPAAVVCAVAAALGTAAVAAAPCEEDCKTERTGVARARKGVAGARKAALSAGVTGPRAPRPFTASPEEAAFGFSVFVCVLRCFFGGS